MLEQIKTPTCGPGTSVPNPVQIVNIITDFGLSARVIDSVEMAFLELFNSELFVGSSREFRTEVLLDYKLTMDTLRGIREVEGRQYNSN